MNVAITGASGFIGRAVAENLQSSGHIVRAVSLRGALKPDALAGVNAVVHLAGEPVAQRWTAHTRDRILRSRVSFSSCSRSATPHAERSGGIGWFFVQPPQANA